MIFLFFFFQAEDGIRDLTVTGVQTCALPISGTDTTGCPVAFFGHLKISNVKPSGGLTAGLSPVLSATVTVGLSVWLGNTKTGGVMWRRSSSMTEKAGGLSFIGGTPSLFARDSNDASG